MNDMAFWQYAMRQPERLALIDPDERAWSRGELLVDCNRIAHALRALGLQPGDAIAALLPNCPEYYAFCLATAQIGLYLVPINWHLAGPEIAYILTDSAARVFVTHERLAEPAAATLENSPHKPAHLISVGRVNGFIEYREWIDQQPTTLPAERMGGALLNYTSGTTGKPKGVYRAVNGRVPPEHAFDSVVLMMRNVCGIEPESGNVHCLTSPLYHTAPMMWSVGALCMGHTVVMMDKWDPQRMLELIQKYRVTTTHMVPTQFTRLLKLPQEVRSRFDLSSVRYAMHGAAPCPPEVKRAMMNWWGPTLHEYYAATEGGGTYVTPQDWLRFPGTVGKATPGTDVRVLDEGGKQVPPGVVGTVYMLRTANLDFEYKGDPEKTRQARTGDYFTVGDVGYLNDAGFLFLCDRKIDMIISGGANIYPAEVENTLILHPAVADCAVFGVPNEDWGEEVKAVVQLATGVVPDEALTSAILTFLASRIAKMKLPRTIDYVQELPRDANGKLYKRRLRDRYWQDRERHI